MPVLTISPAAVVRQLLVDMGLGSDYTSNTAWPCFHDHEPDLKDNSASRGESVTVYGASGRGEGRLMLDGEPSGTDGVQFRVKGRTAARTYAKASAILDAISRRGSGNDAYLRDVAVTDDAGTALGTFLVQCFVSIGSVIELGVDQPNSRRCLATLNAEVRILER